MRHCSEVVKTSRFMQISCSHLRCYYSDTYRLAATCHHPSSLPCSPTSTFYCLQTSTSRRASWALVDGMLMSKQVTIMTRDLHRLTQNSSSSVTCSKASRYSGESLSKLGSKSTVRKQEIPVWSFEYSNTEMLQNLVGATYTLQSTCPVPSLIASLCLPAPPTTLHASPSVPSLAVAFFPASSVYCWNTVGPEK